MSPKAILFDLDGTLADTITDIANAVNITLKRHGYPTHPVESYKLMVGNGFAMMMQRALPQDLALDKEAFEGLVSEATERYQSIALDTTAPFQGVTQTLQELIVRGIKLGVLSNKPDQLTKMIISALFPDVPFVAIEGDLPNRPKKPDPSRALEMLKSIDIQPEDAFFVGDSGVDMDTARNGKMVPCGATWGYRSVEELKEHGARILLMKPRDILDHLDAQVRDLVRD